METLRQSRTDEPFSCPWGKPGAKPAGHFRSSPGGYFYGMVVKAKAGELNLARTIWGMRGRERRAGEGRVAPVAAGFCRCGLWVVKARQSGASGGLADGAGGDQTGEAGRGPPAA